MRGLTKVIAGTAALGLAASLAACGSDSSSDPKPQGEFKTLSGNTTSVKLDPTFLQALTTLKLTPNVLGGAKLDASTGTVSFPITGGNAKIYKKGDVTPYVQGKIEHNGSGLSLKGGSTTVELTNFVVDPGNNSKLTGDVAANGKSVVKGATLFDLDGSTLQEPKISGGVATLTGTTVYLSQAAADLLNKTFNTTALAGDKKVKIGIATIEATGK